MISPEGGWIPVDELPNALLGSGEPLAARLAETSGLDFSARVPTESNPTPAPATPLVIHCRTHRRAGFASLLFLERGIPTVVLRDGVWGWDMDEKVQAYPSYEEGDELPVGKPGSGGVDWGKGEKEVEEILGGRKA